jgi:Trk-type K+ transport system membrane component
VSTGGLLIYLSQDDMSYTDALFLSTSAVTTCGYAHSHALSLTHSALITACAYVCVAGW